MIKFENTRVVGWEAAIIGMRNLKNSWDRSDSFCVSDCNDCPDYNNCEGANDISYAPCRINGYVGPNDLLDLMKHLAAGSPVHAKYRRMIIVYVDITAPLYWWKEFDTYKVGTVANSCSTMHKIADKEFELNDFSHEHLDYAVPAEYRSTGLLDATIRVLNFWREKYLECDEKLKHLDGPYSKLNREHLTMDRKHAWWQMIQLLPSSYNQKRTVMLNYEVLAGIYPMRKNHKLDEWCEHEPEDEFDRPKEWDFGFCDWIKTLPYSELITGDFV